MNVKIEVSDDNGVVMHIEKLAAIQIENVPRDCVCDFTRDSFLIYSTPAITARPCKFCPECGKKLN